MKGETHRVAERYGLPVMVANGLIPVQREPRIEGAEPARPRGRRYQLVTR